MKLPKLIRRWKETRDQDMSRLSPDAKNVQDQRLAVYEMIAAGTADDPALFIIDEIERLSESVARDF
ncbi:hypothetical protein J2X76_005928 [Neorhizobium sp. 2083]|uniref:hypothetical protein n=1 Tax=Neorhizobium sp. 2083 TaxID=2817762 RepID=UPI0028659F50|nr:hypothetical protein [Neorhizobium sp. 2083]MDR6820728.1 hypothetical protein [Neorhizobium sp. 2083]